MLYSIYIVRKVSVIAIENRLVAIVFNNLFRSFRLINTVIIFIVKSIIYLERLNLGTANRSPEARLDVSARGFWNRGQRAFFDVRVFDSSAPRLLTKSLKSIHKTHEQDSKEKSL